MTLWGKACYPPAMAKPHAQEWTDALLNGTDKSRVVATLMEALTAYTLDKGGNPVPDHRTRVTAANLLLMHGRGKPQEAPEVKTDEGQGTRSVTDLSDDALNGIMATLAAEQKRRAGKDPL